MGALDHQTLPFDKWELVLVDDGSDERTARDLDDIAASSSCRARVHHLADNGRPARARNIGWKSVSAEYIAFTDDDCEPSPDWLAAGLRQLQSDDNIGIVQGRTARPEGADDYPYTCFTVVREVLEPSPWFEGCNLFFRRQALEEASGFDEAFGYYFEETSLGWTVVDRGWDRAWSDDALVYHELADRPWRWHLRFHYLERNIVRICTRHPSMRRSFWRPWAVKRENAMFALALSGTLAGIRWRPALVAAVPYLLWLFPPGQRKMGPRAAGHQVSVHLVSLVGKLAVGTRERTFLL